MHEDAGELVGAADARNGERGCEAARERIVAGRLTRLKKCRATADELDASVDFRRKNAARVVSDLDQCFNDLLGRRDGG